MRTFTVTNRGGFKATVIAHDISAVAYLSGFRIEEIVKIMEVGSDHL